MKGKQKRLTINRIAAAGLRANRKAYVALAAGVFLSIFLVTALCMTVQGILLARDARVDARMGRQDAFWLDAQMTDAELLETGYFTEEIGHVNVTARVGESNDIYLGSYDETAEDLLGRVCLEGRMPEAPGEIAVEQSALEKLRIEGAVGDEITLDLTPVGGVKETRTYTLVGILKEQTEHLDVTTYAYSDFQVLHWPTILTCAQEAPFTTGRIVQHCLLMFAPGHSLYTVVPAINERYSSAHFAAISAEGGLAFDDVWMSMHATEETAPTVLMIAMLGGALMLATCVGIAGAMESQLARKTEEIGMLRAVGATKRQIRRVFGRESWLLALIVSPVSVALGCLFAWIVSCAAPEFVLFQLNPVMLVPILLLTTLMIVVSSSLPLRRASNIMPMSVMRDTALLRKTRGIRSKMQFRVPNLISSRQIRLHPTRQLGATALVALMLTVVSLFSLLLVYNFVEFFADSPAYSLFNSGSTGKYMFSQLFDTMGLTESDIDQLEALPMVKKVETYRTAQVNLLMDEIPKYFLPDEGREFMVNSFIVDAHLLPLEEVTDPDRRLTNEYLHELHNELRAHFGLTETVKTIEIQVIEIDPENPPAEVLAGDIDLDALNAGREVLVYAPNIYYTRVDADGGYNATHVLRPGQQAQVSLINDYFVPGMTLDLMQLWAYDTPEISHIAAQDYSIYERVDLHPTVGAVLGGNVRLFWDPLILTTEQGVKALGLEHTRIDSIDIYLTGVPDAQTEELLTRRIETIAMRDDMDVDNYLEIRREDEEQKVQLLLVLGSVAVVFFAVSVGMISGSITRRIRADARMIGTLRAVGADSRAIFGCYSGSIWLTVLLGVALGGLGVFLLKRSQFVPSDYFSAKAMILTVACMIGFSALTLLCCQALVRLRIREVTRRSIVENIREL